MNTHPNARRWWRRVAILALGVIVLGLMAAPAQATLAAGNANPGVLPPNARPYGKSYSEWNDAWVKWILTTPIDPAHLDRYPSLDQTGASCSTNQSGQVWFLAGTLGGVVNGPVIRTCTIPTGKALFFPVANVTCDSTPIPEGWPYGSCGTTYDEMTAAVGPTMNYIFDTADQMATTVDGRAIQDLLNYRATSANLVSVRLPQNNLDNYVYQWLGFPPVAEAGPYQAMADGYYLMLAPLSRGAHTIHITYAGFGLDVTYNLTVR